ncbi:MAG: hypothetical protein H6741_27165 [Alphaproteobacteria bacterium]|nr:hypothetical protein [Alphaproteobacteria bacterium]
MRALLAPVALLPLLACEPLDTPRDVTGNFDVSYEDNLRVYLNDQLVAEVASGEDADVEWDGETFQVSTLCSEEGTECPGETYWHEVAVDQPWGPEYRLLNFVNLDLERGEPGQRLGGLLEDDGTYAMLAGLAVGGDENCAALGVGAVTGAFTDDNQAMVDGILAYAWAGGCQVGDVQVGVSIRLETDFSATRTGDYDVSSVTPEEPIDEDGQVVDPDDPDSSYSVDTEG